MFHGFYKQYALKTENIQVKFALLSNLELNSSLLQHSFAELTVTPLYLSTMPSKVVELLSFDILQNKKDTPNPNCAILLNNLTLMMVY